MKFLKNAAVRATALLVFAAMISAVILWQAGAYDISFIKRPAPHITDTAGTTGSGDDTDPSDNTTTTVTTNKTNTKGGLPTTGDRFDGRMVAAFAIAGVAVISAGGYILYRRNKE